jgi:hypothetical protein
MVAAGGAGGSSGADVAGAGGAAQKISPNQVCLPILFTNCTS